MSSSPNPLSQYFRQPVIAVRLPSGGRFWTTGSVEIPPNQELPVYPMTAVDEITSRTPDALFNGSAVVNVIQSCVPAVKNAWAMPSIDVDTLLISVRIATYGHDMDIDTKCPNCGNEQEYTLDLRNVLDQITTPDYDANIKVSDLEIYFQPMSYEKLNANNQLQFEDQKLMQLLNDTQMKEEEKIKRLSESFLKITHLTVRSLAQSISCIKTRDAIVTETDHIEEFLNNCDRQAFASIRDHAISLRQTSEMKPMHIKCVNCGYEFDQSFTLDMSNFFDTAS